MKIWINIKQLALTTLLFVPVLTHAAVVLPALDITNMSGDTGAAVTNSSFDIDATAFRILFDDPSLNDDIDDEIFTLTSTSGSYDPAADGGFGYGSFGGTFSVGSLLTGSFTDVEVWGFGNGIDFDFGGDVTYSSGSLMGSFAGGRIEGAIEGATVHAVLGEVHVTEVPVPASVWLFASGLIGLVSVARRKAA